MANPVLGTDSITAMIEAQKGFDAMASSVGLVERKYAGLKGAIKGNLFVKTAIQMKAWGKSMTNSIDIMSDWRNLSDEDRKERKKSMSIMQKMLVPMMAYSKIGVINNKIMGRHNNILTRMTTRFLSMFAILGLLIFIFAAVSIAIDGANSPIVEMTEGIRGLEQVVGGMVIVFSGEDGEGGLTGAINLASAALAAFVIVGMVLGAKVGFIVAAGMAIVGVFNMVKNATDSTGAAWMAALSAASVAIGAFLVLFTKVTLAAAWPVTAFFAAIFAAGSAFWAVATGKGRDALAWVAGFFAAIAFLIAAFIIGGTALVLSPFVLIGAAITAFVVAITALVIKHRDWILDTITNFFEAVAEKGTKFKDGFIAAATFVPRTLFSVQTKVFGGFLKFGEKVVAWGRGLKTAFEGGIMNGLKYLWDTPARAWSGFKSGLAGAFSTFVRWYNANVANFLQFDVPRWVPRIGGRSVSIPPEINIPMLAEGGIVTGPTLAMIGEKGPEAVVPLGKEGYGMGGSHTFNIKIDVSGVTDRTSRKDLAMQISDEIQKEMRRYGRGTTRKAI